MEKIKVWIGQAAIGAVIGLLIVGFFCLLTKKGGIEWREFG